MAEDSALKVQPQSTYTLLLYFFRVEAKTCVAGHDRVVASPKCESFVRCVYNFLLPEGVTSEQHPEGDGELAAVSRQSNGEAAAVCW